MSGPQKKSFAKQAKVICVVTLLSSCKADFLEQTFGFIREQSEILKAVRMVELDSHPVKLPDSRRSRGS